MTEDQTNYKLILVSQSLSCINDGIQFCRDLQQLSSDIMPETHESQYVCLMSSFTEIYQLETLAQTIGINKVVQKKNIKDGIALVLENCDLKRYF